MKSEQFGPSPARIACGFNPWRNEYHPLEIDPITFGLQVIESEHHQIHEGYSFTAYYTRTTNNADAHRSGLYLKTPPKGENTNRCHAVASFAASAPAILSICEAPTIAANTGTHTSVIRNRFRDSSVVSQCLNNAAAPAAGYYTTLTEAEIAGDGTWATGTVLRTEPLTSGSAPKAAGGSARGEQELILKADTAYVFLLTNSGANANVHYLMVDWYEHRALAH